MPCDELESMLKRQEHWLRKSQRTRAPPTNLMPLMLGQSMARIGLTLARTRHVLPMSTQIDLPAEETNGSIQGPHPVEPSQIVLGSSLRSADTFSLSSLAPSC